MQDFNSFPNSEWLQQANRFLENISKLAEAYGREWVENLMQLSRSAQTAPDASYSGNSALDTSPTVSGADMISEVEKLGLKLNPSLITLIATSSLMQVKTAIAKYKTYRPQKNPEGLFYTILKNEPKFDNSNF